MKTATDQTEWKAVFLGHLASTGNIRRSCEKAGIARQTAYTHRDSDPEFASAWNAVLEDALDEIEEEARKMALTDRSESMVQFLLKAHRPHIYGNKVQMTGEGGGDIKVTATVKEAATRELAEWREQMRRMLPSS